MLIRLITDRLSHIYSEFSRRRKTSYEKGKEGIAIPRFSNYGTDMASLSQYFSDLNETPVNTCLTKLNNKDADAAYCLAIHETGLEKYKLIRLAATLGLSFDYNDLANLLDKNSSLSDSEEISSLITASANSGVPHAQVTVGWWHMVGKHGFSINYSEALKWNLKAINQGHSEGANNLGQIYEQGLGVPVDLDIAKSWYKAAYVLGNAEATQRLFGLCHTATTSPAIHENTGIVFPTIIGSYSINGINDYEYMNPGKGFSYTYNDNSGTTASVYVYDSQLESVPGSIDNHQIQEMHNLAVDEIFQFWQSKSVTLHQIAKEIITVVADNATVMAFLDGFEIKSNSSSFKTYCLVWPALGYLFKIRVTQTTEAEFDTIGFDYFYEFIIKLSAK